MRRGEGARRLEHVALGAELRDRLPARVVVGRVGDGHVVEDGFDVGLFLGG